MKAPVHCYTAELQNILLKSDTVKLLKEQSYSSRALL